MYTLKSQENKRKVTWIVIDIVHVMMSVMLQSSSIVIPLSAPSYFYYIILFMVQVLQVK